MIGLKTTFWTRLALATACALSFSLAPSMVAMATELPPGVLNYLRQKDPRVKVRFDGLVLFSNGETYVPVIPQDPDLNPDSQQVISTLPENVAYPDLIQFDNNFFLMRLIMTSSGRLTFPKMTEYPMQLKAGLLPQDFVMPNNLFMPVELKIILGALPYNPTYVPAEKPVIVPPSIALSQGEHKAMFTVTNRLTYVFDLNEQKILSISPLTGQKAGEVTMGGVPSGMKLSPDGKLLFVPSLSQNELVVVDTGSNLVKTRVSVGQRPDSVIYVPASNEVVVSNRYSPFLSVVDVTELQTEIRINLPGAANVMAVLPTEKEESPKLLVADSGKPQLYLVDLKSRTVEKTIPTLPDVSAIKALKDSEGHLEIWVASRSKHEIAAMDLAGNVIKTLAVGKKPMDFLFYENQLFVLSAGDARVDVVDLSDKTLKPAIPLMGDSFPSSMVSVPSEQRAYITAAGSTNFIILNLALKQVEENLPVGFRASMIAMTPDAAAENSTITVKQTPESETVQADAAKGKSAGKEENKVKSSDYTGSTQRSGGVRRHFDVFKFGKEAKKPTQTGKDGQSIGMPLESKTENDPATALPVKPGARFEQQKALPGSQTDSSVIGPASSPAAMPEMLGDQQKK